LWIGSVGIEGEHGRTPGFSAPARAERRLIGANLPSTPFHSLGIIAGRANRHQHPSVIPGKDDVPGRMSSRWQLRHHGFGLACRLCIASLVGKANDAVGIGDVNPLRIIPAREKSNSKGPVEAARVNLVPGKLCACLSETQDANSSGLGFRNEDIAVGRHPHLARSVQAFGEKFNFEPSGHLWCGSRRTRDHAREIGGGGRRPRPRQILRSDDPDEAWFVGTPVAKRRSAR
jgi:hypothetical protein